MPNITKFDTCHNNKSIIDILMRRERNVFI